MRTADDLVDRADPGWPIVQEWIATAKNPVDVLAVDPARARVVLETLQVTTRSPMGAIALESGGLVVDGWLRILGGGGPRMRGDLARWNGLGDEPFAPRRTDRMIVALDPAGGVFALAAATRTIAYFAPDTLRWEDLGRPYGDFVNAMMQADLDQLFAGVRWPGWREAVAALPLDRGIQAWPPQWTAEGKRGPVSRKDVPLAELTALAFEIARQLG